MPNQTETKRLLREEINTETRTGSRDLVLDRAGTDNFASDAKLSMIHTRITLGADLTLVSAVDNAAKAGGALLFTFPVGYVTILSARISGSIGTAIADLTSTAGEIGLGTVVASGAAAVLGGTATFEDILQGGVPALGNVLADTDLVVLAGGGIRTGLLGSFAGAAACYLNLASTWGDVAVAGDVVARSGMVIDINWMIVED